jgi:cell division protein ZapA (FtsZ GTPase activity inhibitor)
LEQLVTINLFGQPYTFRAENDSVNPAEVADCLMEEVRKVESHQTGAHGDANKFAMLLIAALNIANEHIKLKKDLEAFKEMIAERSDQLNRHLDAGMQRLSDRAGFRLTEGDTPAG